jgi:N utilization substance protein A
MKRMKRLAKKKPAVKRGISKKVFAKNGSVKKKGDVKTKSGGRKTIGSKAVGEVKKRLRRKSRDVNRSPFPREGQSTRSGQQSGDLQGLSDVESADSESVDELLEEGNAFEADAVTGVEEADNADEKEVHTHEVPEDDVPDEYLDKE